MTRLSLLPAVLLFSTAALLPAKDEERREPETVRIPADSLEIEGWTLEVDQRLLSGEHKALGDRALKMIRLQLGDLTLLMGEKQLADLRKVVVRVDLDHGNLKPAQYHPSPQWLESNGFDPALARKVHIPNAKGFTSKGHHATQPRVLLHELAHAYHHQILRYSHKPIRETYAAAKKSGTYDSVLHVNGRHTKHYGMSNEKEYFAEGTEAYFGANDFYPFVRGELKEHDPDFFDALREIWGPLR